MQVSPHLLKFTIYSVGSGGGGGGGQLSRIFNMRPSLIWNTDRGVHLEGRDCTCITLKSEKMSLHAGSPTIMV